MATTAPVTFAQKRKLAADAEASLKAIGKRPGTPEAKVLDKPGSTSSPDYKLDLSSKVPTSLPTPSLPSAPSVSTPKVETTDTLKEIKSEASKEIKKEVTEIKKVEEKEGSLKKPVVIFIKGMDVFSSPSKSETGYAGVGRIAESIKGSRIYGWDQKDEIVKEIKKHDPSQPVVLVGHSFGGDTAVSIANEFDSLENKFRSIDLLVTMDAVGFGNDIIPQNVKKHLNVFGENDSFLNDGPHVARRHEKTNVQNILSPLDHTELDDDREIQYELVKLIENTLKPQV